MKERRKPEYPEKTLDDELQLLLRRRRHTLDGDAYRPHKSSCPPQLLQVAIYSLSLSGIGTGHMSRLRASCNWQCSSRCSAVMMFALHGQFKPVAFTFQQMLEGVIFATVTIADDGTASGVLRIFIMTQLDMRSTLPTGKQRTADELTLNSVVDPSYCIL